MTDEKYIMARNKLIPEAERYANEVHGKPVGQAEDLAWSKPSCLKWTRSPLSVPCRQRLDDTGMMVCLCAICPMVAHDISERTLTSG